VDRFCRVTSMLLPTTCSGVTTLTSSRQLQMPGVTVPTTVVLVAGGGTAVRVRGRCGSHGPWLITNWPSHPSYILALAEVTSESRLDEVR